MAGHGGRLIAALRRAGVEVDHSPLNPDFGPDPRWDSWYARGCRAALEWADVAVPVVDRLWDSTWMAHEADEATRLAAEGRLVVRVWQPEPVRVARGMRRYLANPLPADLDAAVRALTE